MINKGGDDMSLITEEKAKMRFVSTSRGTIVVGHICNECIYNKGKYATFGEHPEICFFNKTESCSNKMPYYFFQSRSNTSVVVFSKGRIPFELPKANTEAVRELKEELILAIKQLESFENSVLCARYGTTDETKGFYDIENVLFYNIGTKKFNVLAKQSIAFAAVSESEIIKMRKQWNIPEEYCHYYEYTLLPELVPPSQTKGLLASWENISFCKCTGLTPFASWNSIKEEANNIKIYDRIYCDNGDKFALVLEIEKPQKAKFSIMTAMKPLLDGLICAFHNSNFEKEEVECFSQKLGCDRDKIQSAELNVLGERQSKYIQIYCDNLKWNPADDLCQCVTISIIEGNEWRLSGKIYKT